MQELLKEAMEFIFKTVFGASRVFVKVDEKEGYYYLGIKLPVDVARNIALVFFQVKKTSNIGLDVLKHFANMNKKKK